MSFTESYDTGNIFLSLIEYELNSLLVDYISVHIWFDLGWYLENVLNPSFTKPFGTHTLYQKGGRSRPDPCYLKNRCSHKRKILQGIRDIFERLRNVKVVYIMFTWLP